MILFHVWNYKTVICDETTKTNVQGKCGKTEAVIKLLSTSDLMVRFCSRKKPKASRGLLIKYAAFRFWKVKKVSVPHIHTSDILQEISFLLLWADHPATLKTQWSISTIVFVDTQALRKGWLQSLVKVILLLIANKLPEKVVSSPKQVPLKMRPQNWLKEQSFSAIFQT